MLIVARNVLDKNQVKYFLSNMVIDGKQITLEWLLWVAFSRWPIERCFEIGKRDLGMDHFEMRNWQGIHRYFYITQLSMLFCAEVQQHLREKRIFFFRLPPQTLGRYQKFGKFLSGGRTSSPSRSLVDYWSIYDAPQPEALLSANCQRHYLSATPQPTSQKILLQENFGTTEKRWYKCQQIKELCAV